MTIKPHSDKYTPVLCTRGIHEGKIGEINSCNDQYACIRFPDEKGTKAINIKRLQYL